MANYALDTNAGSMVLSTSGYPAGIYIVVVSNAAGNQWQQKLIIERN
jgi:hypothetical protein